MEFKTYGDFAVNYHFMPALQPWACIKGVQMSVNLSEVFLFILMNAWNPPKQYKTAVETQ